MASRGSTHATQGEAAQHCRRRRCERQQQQQQIVATIVGHTGRDPPAASGPAAGAEQGQGASDRHQESDEQSRACRLAGAALQDARGTHALENDAAGTTRAATLVSRSHRRSSGSSAKRFSTLAAGAVDSMRQHGIYAPIAALYGGLRALAAGRTVRTAKDPLTNRSFTPGTFRMQPNGTVQPVHLDSLHAFDRLACRRSCGCDPASAMPPKDRQQARLSTQYSDMRRFSTQFSALVLLQRSDLASNEVSVYGRYIDDIEKSCDIKLMGQKRDAPGPTNSYTLNFDRSSARRSFRVE